MEPSLIGWEWIGPRPDGELGCSAAMEPSLIGWEWGITSMTTFFDFIVPQWSPALSAGNGGSRSTRRCRARSGRNGAQPYRLGMARARRDGCRALWGAAMEPSLIGWEWHSAYKINL